MTLQQSFIPIGLQINILHGPLTSTQGLHQTRPMWKTFPRVGTTTLQNVVEVGKMVWGIWGYYINKEYLISNLIFRPPILAPLRLYQTHATRHTRMALAKNHSRDANYNFAKMYHNRMDSLEDLLRTQMNRQTGEQTDNDPIL